MAVCVNYHVVDLGCRAEGKVFQVPFQDVHIPLPQPGDVVTLSYEPNARSWSRSKSSTVRGGEGSSGPKIFRVRTDITWIEVLLNSHKERKYLNGIANSLVA